MKIKKYFVQVGTLFIFIVFTACSGGNKKENTSVENEQSFEQDIPEEVSGLHRQHNSLAENFAHKDIVILEEKYPVGKETQEELEQVIDVYLKLKNALFREDMDAIDIAIKSMQNKIDFVKPEKLDGKGLDAWEDHIGLYKDKLAEIQHVQGLEEKRSYFSHISEIMYCTIKSFELKEGDLYAVFCPMAFDNKGAYWISKNKEIQNPYFGSKMPKCGEIKEEL